MDVVKRSYAAFRRGDIEGWLETLDSDIEWQAAREDPDAALHRGHDGVLRYLGQWTEAYDGLQVEPREFIDGGDRILVWVHITGRGRASGLDLDMQQAQIATVRGGKIVRTDEYFDRAEALASMGIESGG